MRLRILGMVVAALASASVPARADVHVTITDGHVTVSAVNATIRQILDEWARVGQTRIINAERVSGTPVTIELTNVPEAQALDTILRSVSGYLAAPRPVRIANASTYDRIYLLPTSSGTPPRPVTPSPQSPVGFAPPPFAPPQADDQADDEPRPLVPPQGPANQPPVQRAPSFTTFPQPQVQPRQAPEVPQPAASTPANPTTFGAPTGAGPAGVSTPGMAVPVPQQQEPGAPARR